MEKEKIKYIIVLGEIREVSILVRDKNASMCEYYNIYGRHKTIRMNVDIFNSKSDARKSLKIIKK